MEIIPLIYNALIIAAALAVISLAVSYFVHKTKKLTKAAKPAKAELNQGKLNPPVHSSIKQKHQPVPIPKKEKVIKDKNPAPRKKNVLNRMTSTGQRNMPVSNRIKIVNSLSVPKKLTAEIPPERNFKPEMNKKLERLDGDLLSKYADDDGKNLYVLEVKNKKDIPPKSF